jgi:hypothetical protein
MKIVKVNCQYCGLEKSICPSRYKSSKHKIFFCNKKCKASWQKNRKIADIIGVEADVIRRQRLSQSTTGKSNPNFDHRWDNQQREKASQMMTVRMKDPKYRILSAKGNKGKKRTKEFIEIWHRNNKPHPHTEKTKKIIGMKSKLKFTPELKARMRKLLEGKGLWIPLSEKTDYDLYFELCAWPNRMFDIVEEGRDLLINQGVFNMKKNSKGVVRHHKLSRRDGFDNGVFPEIIRHPANCAIILHGDNVRERFRKSIFNINDLFAEIESYQKPWTEQDLCIQKIREYRIGNRYDRKTYEGGKYGC